MGGESNTASCPPTAFLFCPDTGVRTPSHLIGESVYETTWNHVHPQYPRFVGIIDFTSTKRAAKKCCFPRPCPQKSPQSNRPGCTRSDAFRWPFRTGLQRYHQRRFRRSTSSSSQCWSGALAAVEPQVSIPAPTASQTPVAGHVPWHPRPRTWTLSPPACRPKPCPGCTAHEAAMRLRKSFQPIGKVRRHWGNLVPGGLLALAEDDEARVLPCEVDSERRDIP